MRHCSSNSYCPQEILNVCDEFNEPYEIEVSGIRTSIEYLAEQGWHLHLKCNIPGHTRLKVVLRSYETGATISYKLPKYAFGWRLYSIFSFLSNETFYKGVDVSLHEDRYKEWDAGQNKTLDNMTDLELMNELERRTKEKLKNKKKRRPKSTKDNIVIFQEILKDLEKIKTA